MSTESKKLLEEAQALLAKIESSTLTIQEKYDLASAGLLPIWRKKRELEDTKAKLLEPVKAQEKLVKDALDPDYETLLTHEFLFKDAIRKAYEEAIGLQTEAYTRALEAQSKGDMEAVRQATLDSYKYSLKASGNIFFRHQEDFEITDISAVPREFLQFDSKKILTALENDESIPGVQRISKLSVVVKEQK